MASTEYGSIYIKPGELPQIKPNLPVTIVDHSSSPVKDSEPLQKALDRVYGGSKGGGSSSRVVLGSAPVLKPEFSPDFSQSIREIKDGTYISQLNRYISESPTGAGSTGYIRSPTPAESEALVYSRRYDLYDRPISEIIDTKYQYNLLTSRLNQLDPEKDREKIESTLRELEKIGANIKEENGTYIINPPKVGIGITRNIFTPLSNRRQVDITSVGTQRKPEEKSTYAEMISFGTRNVLSTSVSNMLRTVGVPEEGIGTKQYAKDISWLGQNVGSFLENLWQSPAISRTKEKILFPGESIVIPEEKRNVNITSGTTGYYNPLTGKYTDINLPESELTITSRTITSIVKTREEILREIEENPSQFYNPLTKPEVAGNIAGGIIYYSTPGVIYGEYLGTLGEITARKGNLWEGIVTTTQKYPFETLAFTLKAGTDIYKGANKFFNEPITKRTKLSPEKTTDETFRFLEQPKTRTIVDPATGKEVTIQSQRASGVWEVVKEGEKVEVTTRARELFGARVRFDLVDDGILGIKTTYIPATPIYSGTPSDVAGRQEAIKLLTKFKGLTPEQAKQVIKLTRPGLFEETFTGNIITQYGDDTVNIFARGTRTTTSLPGEIGGVKFMQITPRIKTLGETSKPLFTIDLTKSGGNVINVYKFAGALAGSGKPETFFGTGATTKLTATGGYTDPITGVKIDVYSRGGEVNLYRDVDFYKKLNIPKTTGGKEITTEGFFKKLFSRKTPEMSTGYTVVQTGTVPDDEIFMIKGEGSKSSPDYFQKLYETVEAKKVEALAGITKPTTFTGGTTPIKEEAVSWVSQTGIPASEYYGKPGSIIEEVEILRMPPGVKTDSLIGVGLGLNTGLNVNQDSLVIQVPKLGVEEDVMIKESFDQPVITDVISRTGQGQDSILRQAPILDIKPIQVPAQTPIKISLSTSFTPRKSGTTKQIPKIIISSLVSGEGRDSKKLTKGLFKVKVRKKGEDVTIGEFETLPKARKRLRTELIETISASGIIERAGKPLKFEEVGIYGTQFRRAKSDPFRVVQRKEARIKTGGEITQILKTRKSKGGWFR